MGAPSNPWRLGPPPPARADAAPCCAACAGAREAEPQHHHQADASAEVAPLRLWPEGVILGGMFAATVAGVFAFAKLLSER